MKFNLVDMLQESDTTTVGRKNLTYPRSASAAIQEGQSLKLKHLNEIFLLNKTISSGISSNISNELVYTAETKLIHSPHLTLMQCEIEVMHIDLPLSFTSP